MHSSGLYLQVVKFEAKLDVHSSKFIGHVAEDIGHGDLAAVIGSADGAVDLFLDGVAFGELLLATEELSVEEAGQDAPALAAHVALRVV